MVSINFPPVGFCEKCGTPIYKTGYDFNSNGYVIDDVYYCDSCVEEAATDIVRDEQADELFDRVEALLEQSKITECY